MSSRDRWQSVQSVCSRLTAVGKCRADAIVLVTQTNDAVHACAMFQVSVHLLEILLVGEYKRTPLKFRTPHPTPSQRFREYFCGISKIIDNQTKIKQKVGQKFMIVAIQQ